MKFTIYASIMLPSLATAASVCPSAPKAYNALLKQEEEPKAFCTNYLWKQRKLSPIKGFEPAAVSKACTCLVGSSHSASATASGSSSPSSISLTATSSPASSPAGLTSPAGPSKPAGSHSISSPISSPSSKPRPTSSSVKPPTFTKKPVSDPSSSSTTKTPVKPVAVNTAAVTSSKK